MSPTKQSIALARHSNGQLKQSWKNILSKSSNICQRILWIKHFRSTSELLIKEPLRRKRSIRSLKNNSIIYASFTRNLVAVRPRWNTRTSRQASVTAKGFQLSAGIPPACTYRWALSEAIFPNNFLQWIYLIPNDPLAKNSILWIRLILKSNRKSEIHHHLVAGAGLMTMLNMIVYTLRQ